MADVQLEHGHVRIANRLFEAILDAGFTPTQVRILLGLVRLTYGWRRRTVTIGHAGLARAVHLNPGGTFRAALRELVVEGVVLQLEQGFGDAASTLTIQKDFTEWGQFAVSPVRLARIYDERPESHDELLSPPPLPLAGQGDDHPLPADGSAHTEEGGVPLNGHTPAPVVGTGTTGNSLGHNAATARKDRKTERQGSTEVVVDRPHAVVRLVVMANKGLSEHAEFPQPIPHILVGQPSAADATDGILDAGVPLPFAESTIYTLAKSHRAGGRVRSLRYFESAVITAWQREQAATDAAGASAPADPPCPPPPPRPPRPSKQEAGRAGLAEWLATDTPHGPDHGK